jgi:predicted dehydrogenase
MNHTESIRGSVLRWGVVGCGRMAAKFCADIGLSADSAVVSVASSDLDRGRVFAEHVGASRWYGSYGELFADPDVDLVYIATWDGSHSVNALGALRAAKPVLVEKAFALNAAQAREVVGEARSRQLFCMEAMWARLNPLIRACRSMTAEGMIGDIRTVQAAITLPVPFDAKGRMFDTSAGGGVLLGMGVYPISFAYQLLGYPDEIGARGTLSSTGSDVTAIMSWRYRDGRNATLSCSGVDDVGNGARITGTAGSMTVEPSLLRPERLVVRNGSGERRIEASDLPPGNEGYRPLITEVEQCLSAGAIESAHMPLDETVGVLATIDEARIQLGVRYPADVDTNSSQ